MSASEKGTGRPVTQILVPSSSEEGGSVTVKLWVLLNTVRGQGKSEAQCLASSSVLKVTNLPPSKCFQPCTTLGSSTLPRAFTISVIALSGKAGSVEGLGK